MVKLTAENRFLQKKGDGNYEVETKIKRKKKTSRRPVHYFIEEEEEERKRHVFT